MHVNRKILTGVVIAAMPLGIIAVVTVPGAINAFAKKAPAYTTTTCSDLNGTTTNVDFTNVGAQEGLTPTGQAFIAGAAVSASSRGYTAISSSGTPTDCSGGVTSTGTVIAVDGPLGMPTIAAKPAKEEVIQNCAAFTSGTKDLKKQVIQIPTQVGIFAFTIKSASALAFSNPPTSLNPGGGAEVGFALSGTAEISGVTASLDKSATAEIWLDPTDSAALASCSASPQTYVGSAITGATIDPQDSSVSF